MKQYLLIILCFAISGCVTIDHDATSVISQPKTKNYAKGKKSLTHIAYIYPSMTQKEVAGIMGASVTIGYEKIGSSTKDIPITLKNPYRNEILKRKEKTYHIDYYFTYIQKADDIVSDDELTPLIFYKNKLISKGWNALFSFKQQK